MDQSDEEVEADAGKIAVEDAGKKIMIQGFNLSKLKKKTPPVNIPGFNFKKKK